MAYNRYRGGYGRPERVETPARERPVSPLPPPESPKNARRTTSAPARPSVVPGGMNTEDWLVAAILYLAYRSSGDWEMLAALGAYLFL